MTQRKESSEVLAAGAGTRRQCDYDDLPTFPIRPNFAGRALSFLTPPAAGARGSRKGSFSKGEFSAEAQKGQVSESQAFIHFLLARP